MTTKTITKIGAIIFDDRGNLLAVHKRGKPNFELIVPGGRQEVNETDAETLKRELREELSVDANVEKLFGEFKAKAIYEDAPLCMRVYYVKLSGMPKPTNEIDKLVWLDQDYQQSPYTFASILGKEILPRVFSKEVNPFTPTLQRYWDQRYDYFSLFDDGIKIDEEGLHSVMPEQTALEQTQLLKDSQIILDGFCGVGGLAIAYARAGKKVIAIDNNQERIAIAKHNAKIYNVADNITFIQGDFMQLAPTIQADAVLLDPPWGWPRKQGITKFELRHLMPDGNRILKIARHHFKKMILRMPTTFDATELEKKNINYIEHADKLNGKVISRSFLIEGY